MRCGRGGLEQDDGPNAGMLKNFSHISSISVRTNGDANGLERRERLLDHVAVAFAVVNRAWSAHSTAAVFALLIVNATTDQHGAAASPVGLRTEASLPGFTYQMTTSWLG